jgi:ABC-type branched-subunit amino acid transport system ATPase component
MANSPTIPLLLVKDLTVDFGGLRALDRVSFDVGKGQLLGLVGPNGAGKSTFFNAITGFVKPTAGKAYFRGQDITGLPPHKIAQKGIIRTFQVTSLLPDLTAIENIMSGFHRKLESRLPKSLARAVFNTEPFKKQERNAQSKAMEILDLLEMSERRYVVVKNMPNVEQRKMEIAIALAAEPELLLLDEPAAGMNLEEASKLMRLVENLRDTGLTILLVEHNMRVVMGVCEGIIVLSNGVKIAEGTPAEVRSNNDVINVYLGARRENAGDKRPISVLWQDSGIKGDIIKTGRG